MSDRRVLIYTDGSCSTRDGSGGFAAVIKYGKWEKIVQGYAVDTTNQQMEMEAAIAALAALNRDRPWEVVIYSDSAYVVNCFLQGWIPKWRARGWRTGKNKPVANQERWETLESLVALHKVEFVHVRGHSGHALNERVDQLAHEARMEGLRLTREKARASAR